MALALSIAIHEILAGLISTASSPVPPQREVVARVELVRIQIHPSPKPQPTPPPPPRVITRSHVVAALQTPRVTTAVAGASARKEIVRAAGAPRPRPPVVAQTKPVWDLPVGGRGAGAGVNSGAGSLGNGGNGPGTGTSGSGSGASSGSEPCGFVTFQPERGSLYDPRTGGFWVDIRMSVRFPDGRSDSIMLDYPFYYPNEASNPWSEQNLGDRSSIPFQFPPPEKRADEPPLVQYVVAHTTAEGYTLLKDCPSPGL